MTSQTESYLIFEDYSVSDMVFKRNYNFDDEREVELNFDFDASAQFTEDKNGARLNITCKIFEEEFQKNEAPFYLEISIVGIFTQDGDVKIDTFQLNSMAILLPYLRSIVTSFTSQSGMPPVIIPPINVYKAFEKVNKNES